METKQSKVGKWLIAGFDEKQSRILYERFRSKAYQILKKKHEREYKKIITKLKDDFLRDLNNKRK